MGGLSTYLSKLLTNPTFATSPVLLRYLGSSESGAGLSLEDALPSTLSRKTALTVMGGGVKMTSITPVAAAYYPDWATGTISPQDIDFSKFDILLFGTSARVSQCCVSELRPGQRLLRQTLLMALTGIREQLLLCKR